MNRALNHCKILLRFCDVDVESDARQREKLQNKPMCALKPAVTDVKKTMFTSYRNVRMKKHSFLCFYMQIFVALHHRFSGAALLNTFYARVITARGLASP